MTKTTKKERIVNYIRTVGSEPSTWRGVTLLATASGYALSEDAKEAILTWGLLIAGFIGAVFPDKKKKVDQDE